MKNYTRKNRALWLTSICATLISSPLIGEEQALSADQALFLRRITEYWRDGDLKTAKNQIISFLQEHPTSSVNGQLHAMLGDLYFQENLYVEAIAEYEKINDASFTEKIALNYFQSLYELKETEKLIAKGSTFLKENPSFGVKGDKIRFLLADSMQQLAAQSSSDAERDCILRDALEHYTALQQTRYKEFSLFAQAEIHNKLGNKQQSAELYLQLSSNHPEQEEELLFTAAHLQTTFDPALAVETFTKIAELKGEKSYHAAHNALILLYQNKLFPTVIEKENFFRKSLLKEDAPLLELYLGLSYYQMEEYESAKRRFTAFLEHKDQSKERKLSALLHTAECARKLDDDQALSLVIDHLSKDFPEEKELAKALIARAHLLAKKGNFQAAVDDLKNTLSRFPHLDNREELVYNYALLLTKQESWNEARELFYLFLDQFPESEKTASAWRCLLTTSMNIWKTSTTANRTAALHILIDDLQKVLILPSILEKSEVAEFQFFLATKLFEENRLEEASAEFERHLALYPDSEKNGQIHYLLTLCLFKLQSDTDALITYAEKALSLDTPLEQRATLHLHLFNAYLSKADESPDLQEVLHNKAAQNLYSAIAGGCQTIKLQNIAWLADHYFNQIKPFLTESNLSPEKKKLFATCGEIYALLFPENATDPFALFDRSTAFLEPEALRYAQYLQASGKSQKHLQILEQLVNAQNTSPDKGWKHRQEALFDLGETYRNRGDSQKAILAYDQLNELAKWVPSYYASAALLESTRLKYQLLPAKDRSENNPEMAAILNNLKDLQISKKLAFEPVHLEAALQYVDIRTELAPKDEKNQHCLFFLKRLKEDFSSEADPLTRDYLSAKENYPDKASLYSSYLQYVESKILYLEALIARQEGYRDTAKSLKNQAMNNLKALNNETTTNYLEQNIKSMRKEIEKSF